MLPLLFSSRDRGVTQLPRERGVAPHSSFEPFSSTARRRPRTSICSHFESARVFSFAMPSKPRAAPHLRNREPENVLIALVGLSPAVLTETVFALLQEDPPLVPDRIVVLTTATGARLLRDAFFTRGTWAAFLDHLEAEAGSDLRNSIRFGPIDDCIRILPNADRSADLEDIRTQADNCAVAEYLLETLRAFTENDQIRVIASMAGGRKTAGALLHSVLTLLGRAHDRMTHVLVSDPWDRVPGFFFPGCPGTFVHPDTDDPLNSHQACVELAEVPFVPLRYLFRKELNRHPGSYLRLMDQLRSRALDLDREVSIEFTPAGGQLRVNHLPIQLSPREYALYLWFARRVLDHTGPLPSLNHLEADDLKQEAARHNHPQVPPSWVAPVLDSGNATEEDARRLLSSIRNKMKSAGIDPVAIDRLVPRRGRLSIQISTEKLTLNQNHPTTADRP
ncbi:MAG: TIGR02584 family CRISPR-associated protein [Puniceicoccaceae bacterium]|nr:MAG: TIGR02584 family CRISPR-associated protein [Puniceicoccaceae bacterium]